ncbi:Metallo-beta-lactamase superfamily protein [Streptomyces netropsis]|uniref:Glyoxylase-like metal-dependent hydrolase (Beta-lactamase superfamily II) n=1 Tax=Streptomyces syringium TaxID=76729 RepID=A0ABS4XYI5_9ACTN|nr:MBL fold metallo-hydrolase [Streptomyces syringium]MBP2401430.1 glyoxylase-like metal-dependent hydrolase (beta-lactamase superfamily II) [Streptomyces syringium]SPE62963.1 Metallo-beta-lactamase superfamily protein [Streptomyces netropsis]
MRTAQLTEPITSDLAAHWTVGDITIHRIHEIPLPPRTGPWLLPAATAEVVAGHDWLRPDFAGPDGVLRIDSHSFALVVDGLRVLVDTGIGNGKTRENPAWNDLDTDYLARLAGVGFAPEGVDLVVLTHLHTDHVGWNTREVDGVWVPTFPNARYLTAKAEYDFWAAYDMDEARRGMFSDSVIPIAEAGLLETIDVPDEGVDVADGLRLLPAPGHTPGQLAVQVSSAGAAALITGDSIHHPVQLAHPGIGSCVDIDPAQAEATRRALLARLADTGALVLGTHFPAPTAGRVVTDGDGYRLEAVAAGVRPAAA